MKFALVAAALVGSAVAQEGCLSLALKVPQCGTSCVSSAASGVGCAQTDFACQCSSSQNAAINSAAQQCVISACSDIQTALMVQSAAADVCKCAATAAPASSGAGSTTMDSSMAGATGGAGSMSMSDMSSSMASMTGAMASSTGDSDSDSDSSSSAINTSPAASAISTAGAATVVGSVGGIMGGLLAIIAAL